MPDASAVTPSDTPRLVRIPDTIECRASWMAASITLAILSFSYGAPLVVVVGLKPIAAALDADRDVSRPPLTPVLINLAEVPPNVDLAPGVRGRYRPLDLMYSIWDLILFVHVDGTCGRARLELSADYATDLFDRTTITDLLEALRHSALDLTTSLEDPVLKPSSDEIDFDNPAARLELVRSVWREVLVTDDLDDDTGFFDAGGNSLLLVALVEELSRATRRTFKTMEVFRAGSIAGQAELLARAGDAADGRRQ